MLIYVEFLVVFFHPGDLSLLDWLWILLIYVTLTFVPIISIIFLLVKLVKWKRQHSELNSEKLSIKHEK
jgi:hypothetical protein